MKKAWFRFKARIERRAITSEEVGSGIDVDVCFRRYDRSDKIGVCHIKENNGIFEGVITIWKDKVILSHTELLVLSFNYKTDLDQQYIQIDDKNTHQDDSVKIDINSFDFT